MIKPGDQLPRYLLEKQQVRMTVTYTALFSLVFLLIVIPFSGRAWFALGASQAFFYTLAFALTVSLVVVLSRSRMFRYRDIHHLTVLGCALWLLAEAVAAGLLYLFFTRAGEQLGLIRPTMRSSGGLFLVSFGYALVCLIVPFVLAAVHFTLQERDNTVRLMNYGNVVSDKPAVPYNDKRITLFDNNGVLKFAISSDNLYFIESDDNYIKVWYLDSGGEMKQYMLRCRLKTVEDSFADSELVRCHRKYIVNIRKVSILKSEKEGYKIDFDLDSLDSIPISKTYEQAVLSRFNSR